MASFNPMSALPVGANVGTDAMGFNVNPSAHAMGMDAYEQELTFDESLLDNVNGLPPLPFTPSYDFETFSTTFEDPFSYSATRPYEAAPDPTHFNEEEASAPELDNKLLGFSAPLLKATVIDETGSFAEMNMGAELFGMFFVAEDVYNADTTGRPLELTCYRRNLWQCSGQITLPRHVAHVVTEQGLQVPVFELAASITAIESIEGKPTEIISIPWKSTNLSAGGNGDDSSKVAGAPPHVPLDLSSGQELDGPGARVSVPVSWKRLQFKHATANNGRRKGLQQHYVVQINLLGKTKTGEYMKIAEIQSGPVIVRGRSPRNFDSRKDVPLSGGTSVPSGGEKKADRRSLSGEGIGATPGNGVTQERGDLAQNLQRYHSLGNIQSAHCRKQSGGSNNGDWSSTPQPYNNQSSSHSPHPTKKMALSPNMPRPPVPAWTSEASLSSTGSNKLTPMAAHKGMAPTLPINLSLSEDERSPKRPEMAGGGSGASPPFSKAAPTAGAVSQGAAMGESPMENGDMLYEYFPLSLDDWMPPVDAIYRPHVVHHTVVPPEVKAQQVRSKTKRYFAAE